MLQYSRQLVINPFHGYPEEQRNIMDPALRETIKEFSAIDGAFVIRGDGIIEAAGRHLNAAPENDLPPGLGSRHMAGAGITEVSTAISFAISESTGSVTVLKDGKVFMQISKVTACQDVHEGKRQKEIAVVLIVGRKQSWSTGKLFGLFALIIGGILGLSTIILMLDLIGLSIF